ncbi:MAG: hypothetical protein VKJ05_02000 [Synechococcaceae cyanobacterium]|nr:hypothetical protein [Synechococcaceae cyanobacterium]
MHTPSLCLPAAPSAAPTRLLVGRLGGLWHHPLRSMLGEPRARLEVEPGGVAGDRGYAPRDGQLGRVASARNPWVRLNAPGSTHLRSGQLAPTPLPDLALPGPEHFGGLAPGERGLVLSLITARS